MAFLSLSQKKLKPEQYDALVPRIVEEIHQIKFPCGFKQTFNSSWTHYNDELVMAVRAGNFWDSPFSSYIGITSLSDDLEPIHAPIWLDIPLSHPEDPRLIVVGESLWMLIHARGPMASFKIYACPLEKKEGLWALSKPPIELIYPDAPAGRIEKSWMPLVQKNELYLIYSLSPYTLTKPDLETGLCTKVDVPPTTFSWDFGAPKGSTQVIPSKDGYIGIFHSSMFTEKRPFRPRTKYYYFLGGFLLDQSMHLKSVSQAPFSIPEFYGKGDGWCIFPCGLMQHEEKLILSAGKNDRITLAITLDQQQLQQSLCALPACC